MSSTQIFVFNCGHGDNHLIKFPNDTYGLIDFHYESSINPLREPPSLTFLKTLHQKSTPIKLAFLHFSHYHVGNIKGLEIWLDWIKKEGIELDELWIPGSKPKLFPFDYFNNKSALSKVLTNTPGIRHKIYFFSKQIPQNPLWALKNFLKLEKKLGFSTRYLDDPGEIKNFMENTTGVKAFVIAPNDNISKRFFAKWPSSIIQQLVGDKYQRSFIDTGFSSFLLFKYENMQILFGGHSSHRQIQKSFDDFNNLGLKLEVDFVKAPLHGSKNASSPQIWNTIVPKKRHVIAVISSGDYAINHPDEETLDHINQSNAIDPKFLVTKPFELLSKNVQKVLPKPNIDSFSIPWPKTSKRSKEYIEKKIRRLSPILINPKILKKLNLIREQQGILGYHVTMNPNSSIPIESKRLVVGS